MAALNTFMRSFLLLSSDNLETLQIVNDNHKMVSPTTNNERLIAYLSPSSPSSRRKSCRWSSPDIQVCQNTKAPAMKRRNSCDLPPKLPTRRTESNFCQMVFTNENRADEQQDKQPNQANQNKSFKDVALPLQIDTKHPRPSRSESLRLALGSLAPSVVPKKLLSSSPSSTKKQSGNKTTRATTIKGQKRHLRSEKTYPRKEQVGHHMCKPSDIIFSPMTHCPTCIIKRDLY